MAAERARHPVRRATCLRTGHGGARGGSLRGPHLVWDERVVREWNMRLGGLNQPALDAPLRICQGRRPLPLAIEYSPVIHAEQRRCALRLAGELQEHSPVAKSL